MIYKVDRKTQAQWARGELKVQVLSPHSDRPIAYCDGTDDDVAELHRLAEDEDTELTSLHRRVLKTGRELWTVTSALERLEVEDDD